ncbi:MAG TPA: thioredoxin domain-containing protein [Vicinamibacterales bacterium]|nr:thioredoxin domain-containing protein [Vicinamibacterales bacterium]
MHPRIVAAALALALSGCSTSAQSQRQPLPTDVVATVGSRSITLAEADAKALQQPASNYGAVKLAQALYLARRSAIDDMVAEVLFDQAAKAKGIERSALVEQEITAKITPVSDADVNAWYDANRGRVQGATLEQVRQPIRQYLTQERMQEVRTQYLDTLKASTPVRITLEPPRQQVAAAAGSPSKGPANAPVEIVEFSDFQCPFCLRAHPTVTQVLNTYGDKVHFVYRHYPLPGHPNARPAAEAASCAAEQGQFWLYYDRLFADQTKLDDANLKKSAADLGMDAARFNACVDTRKYKAAVDADVAAGQEAGVDGTPAFFVNGRLLSGAQPFDQFKKLIDEELAMKKK